MLLLHKNLSFMKILLVHWTAVFLVTATCRIMQYKTRKAIILSFLFLLLLVVSASQAIAKESASLSKVKGEVSVFKQGKPKSIEGSVGMPLFVGDKIVTTGKKSLADISFPNGDIVRVMPNSKLEIKVADFRKKTSSIRMKLLSGKIFNVVRKLKGESKYEVETRVAVAGVRGTVWSAETSEGGEDVFMVKEGKVAAKNPEVAPEKEILVSDLKKTIVRKDKIPTTPVSLSPEEIAMFDILDDLSAQITDDMRDDIRDNFAEDMMMDRQ